jgi:peptidoglycan hydrolase CwlO-like protein
MADIPALVASIDARLDQLAAQISTLQDARTALQAQTLIAAPAPPRGAGAAAKRTRRQASQTTKPATAAAHPARPRRGIVRGTV